MMIFPLIYVCVYVNESWPLKNSHVQKMHIVAKMQIWRWMCGHTLSDKRLAIRIYGIKWEWPQIRDR